MDLNLVTFDGILVISSFSAGQIFGGPTKTYTCMIECKEKRSYQMRTASSMPWQPTTFTCSNWGRECHSWIRLHSHSLSWTSINLWRAGCSAFEMEDKVSGIFQLQQRNLLTLLVVYEASAAKSVSRKYSACEKYIILSSGFWWSRLLAYWCKVAYF